MDINSRQIINEPDKHKKKSGKCYYYSKKEHFIRDYQKKQTDKKTEKLGEQIRIIKEIKIADK